jgi:hypothetical protein
MLNRREIWAIAIAAAVALAFLIAFLPFTGDEPSVTAERADEQNSGTNAPHEVVGEPEGGDAAQSN